jgi:CO/xanthine dehydrogenase Mo-binding subunit
MRDKLGGRRFLLAAASGIVTAVLQYAGKLDAAGSTYAMVIVGTVAAYITGNVSERNTINKSKESE